MLDAMSSSAIWMSVASPPAIITRAKSFAFFNFLTLSARQGRAARKDARLAVTSLAATPARHGWWAARTCAECHAPGVDTGLGAASGVAMARQLNELKVRAVIARAITWCYGVVNPVGKGPCHTPHILASAQPG